MKKPTITLLILLIGFGFSCENLLEESDLRDDIIGTYKNVNYKIYALDESGLPALIMDSTTTDMFSINKDGDNEDRINISWSGGNREMFANDLKQYTNGIGFNIPYQTTYWSGNYVDIKGFNSFISEDDSEECSGLVEGIMVHFWFVMDNTLVIEVRARRQ